MVTLVIMVIINTTGHIVARVVRLFWFLWLLRNVIIIFVMFTLVIVILFVILVIVTAFQGLLKGKVEVRIAKFF
jgi:hypothetical protein